MADIFGKSALDYQHLRDAHDKSPEILTQYLENSARSIGNEPHNFNVRPIDLQNATVAETVGYMTDNLQALQDVVDEVLYVENRHMEYLPMITIPEGAETYRYRVLDKVGLAVYLEEEATTPPDATVSIKTVPYNIYYGGVQGTWTRRALAKSVYGGIALDDETIRAATKSAIDRIELTLFKGENTIGETATGEYGFTNLPAAANAAISGTSVRIVSTSADKLISTASNTNDEILDAMNGWLTGFIKDTNTIIGNQISGGLTFYFPTEAYNSVTTRRLRDTERSIWEYFQQNNTWRQRTGEEIMLREMIELNGDSTNPTASTTNRTERAIIALNNTDIMEWAMSVPPRVIEVAPADGYTIRAPMEFAHSGLQVKRSAGIRYIDGV